MLAPDTLLQQRYQIVRLIGQGGMGAVYEALDRRLDTTVALKQTLTPGSKLERAFEREARLLGGLRHPSLPRVIDHFVDESGRFLVMEFIPGDDLGTILDARSAPFPAREVLAWGDQLLGVLEYLHSREPPVLHRDIKPQNVKLSAEGVPVLLDFGLARGEPSVHSQVSTAGSVFGYTPHYAPIEQIHNSGTDQRSDLYALAATLYHLLTGAKPLDALSRATAILRRQPDPLASPTDLNPRVPPEVSAVLLRGLSLNQEERPASAAEMRAALLRAAELPPGAQPDWEAPTVLAPLAPTLAAGAPAENAPAPQEARKTVALPRAAARTLPDAARALAALEPALAALRPLLQRGAQLREKPWAWPALVAGLLGVLALLVLGARGEDAGRATAGPTAPATRSVAGASSSASATPRVSASPTAALSAATPARDVPAAVSIEPPASYVGTLPLALTVRGSQMDGAGEARLVAASGATIEPEVRSQGPSEALLVITELPGPLDGEQTFVLVLDGVEQPVSVALRDYRERMTLQGVREEYLYTGRVGRDSSGALTQMLAQPEGGSQAVAVLRDGDVVELLRDDVPGWYQVRLRIQGQITQSSVIGWIERWLVDNQGAPEATLFASVLGRTPTDAAVRCGSQFRSSVYGSVERADGSGIGGALVRVSSADGRNTFTQRTRSDGTYTVGGLGCTTWLVELAEVPGVSGLKADPVAVQNLNGGLYTAAEVRFRQQP
jgi:eukaryotic-like serine/threonine-protein kinase